MVENAITKVARIAAHAAQGLVYKDSAGKEQTILPTGDKNMIDISGLSIGNGSGGDISGGDNPTVGADYYPGSVYDGTISGRTLLYSGVTSTTDKTNIVFPESVGAGLRLLGDGIQIRLKLLKTLVTRGVVDTSSTEITLVYDIFDKQVKGSFVTIAPLPVSIKKDDILSDNDLVIPLDGIGEGKQSAEIKSPELHIQYDSKTNSINVWNVQGYALDNLTDTKTGTFYDVQATLINNFYVQDSVAQLPVDMNLFTGDLDGEVELTGTNSYFDNIGDSIQVNAEPYLFFADPSIQNKPESRLPIAQFKIPHQFIIDKKDLISGNSIHIDASIPSQLSSLDREEWEGDHWYSYGIGRAMTIVIKNQEIAIRNGKIEITLKIGISWSAVNSKPSADAYMKITSIQTYKGGE